jgi:alpha-galactosidase
MGDTENGVVLAWDDHAPVSMVGVVIERVHRTLKVAAAVEILTADMGHLTASRRLAHTEFGSRLRYVGHRHEDTDTTRALIIRQNADGIDVDLTLRQRIGTTAVSFDVTVVNNGSGDLVLRSVTSSCFGFSTSTAGDPLADWTRTTGSSDWLGEGRWSTVPLRGPDFPRLGQELAAQDPRGGVVLASRGTWSTGLSLPVGVLESVAGGMCVAWQVEHNGAWRAEIGEDSDGGYLALAGPTDDDSGWTRVLAPGESFATVPVTTAWARDRDTAVATLTAHRRLARRPHPDNLGMPIVFNDYMNTLNADPTTEKLLPLVAAAAKAGAEVFCIDAGWYDETGDWWDSVGEWMPSTTRFSNGLSEVIDAIRDAGMTPGLWLEPEVVGVESPVAQRLPADAFLQRNGSRLVEHRRYHLDLRHPAAIAHLDSVVDRLITDFSVGFFKFDYNINPGSGTDVASDSPGDGLLRHNRAHLSWLDGLLDRHPTLIIENCASGAMRMDFAMLSRLAMQSTSDQQDFVKYPSIASAAPMSVLPEQAANWAYPQPAMTDEEISFCLVTGLLGRFYLSGHLDDMTETQHARVAEAVAVAKVLRAEVRVDDPFWPLGLPGWVDDWVALGLRGAAGDLVTVWRRGEGRETVLPIPHRRGEDIVLATVFPRDLPSWEAAWDRKTAMLTLSTPATDGVAARTFRLSPQ